MQTSGLKAGWALVLGLRRWLFTVSAYLQNFSAERT